MKTVELARMGGSEQDVLGRRVLRARTLPTQRARTSPSPPQPLRRQAGRRPPMGPTAPIGQLGKVGRRD
eukprot:2295763-Pleurochrysis_carterae.AAC.1